MSNPGVITLADAKNKNGKIKRFQIEDNIGESIHLHIDNMRMDFTIKEYLEFSSLVKKSLENLNFLQNYKLENFDVHFLKECANYLPNLSDISIEEIRLSDLKCILRKIYKRNLSLLSISPIKNSPSYNYLKGNKDRFIKYEQYNYLNVNNEKRLLNAINSIKANGYPYLDNYIILFSGQNYIRDGQHRASILADIYGLNAKVKVMRFNFKGNDHKLNPFTSNIKTTTIWFEIIIKKYLHKYLF